MLQPGAQQVPRPKTSATKGQRADGCALADTPAKEKFADGHGEFTRRRRSEANLLETHGERFGLRRALSEADVADCPGRQLATSLREQTGRGDAMASQAALKEFCAKVVLAKAIEQDRLALVEFLGRVGQRDTEAMAQEKLRGVEEETGEVLEGDAAEFRARLGQRTVKKRRGVTAGIAGGNGSSTVFG